VALTSDSFPAALQVQRKENDAQKLTIPGSRSSSPKTFLLVKGKAVTIRVMPKASPKVFLTKKKKVNITVK